MAHHGYRKNQVVTAEVFDINNLGNGVARLPADGAEGGIVLFLPGTVPGDRVEAKIILAKSDYLVGKVTALLFPSPLRSKAEERCPHAGKCGGCAYQLLSYEEEKKRKRDYVVAALRKHGLDIPVGEVVTAEKDGAPLISGYRNKVQYPFTLVDDRIAVGYYASHSHRVVEAADCPLSHPAFLPVIGRILGFLNGQSGQGLYSVYDEETGKGLLRHLCLRLAEGTGEMMVTLVINGKALPREKDLAALLCRDFPQIKSVQINENIKSTNVIYGPSFRVICGEDFITDDFEGLRWRISAPAFYQVNTAAAKLLYGLAAERAALQEGDRLCDLFCGVGTIGLYLAKKATPGSLIGVEIVPEAVENARGNALLCGVEHARFFCGDADHEAVAEADVIVIDPPRKGCDSALIQRLCEIGPRRIVYVSCSPDTLARDLALFREEGYGTDLVTPVDLFPRTGHCECVVGLWRQGATHQMKLHAEPFDMIASGQKSVELRLWDEKRQAIAVGDRIEFRCTDGRADILVTEVSALHRFDSFEALYQALPLNKCGYTEAELATASAADMDLYYSKEEQAKYGVVGIEIRLM